MDRSCDRRRLPRADKPGPQATRLAAISQPTRRPHRYSITVEAVAVSVFESGSLGQVAVEQPPCKRLVGEFESPHRLRCSGCRETARSSSY